MKKIEIYKAIIETAQKEIGWESALCLHHGYLSLLHAILDGHTYGLYNSKLHLNMVVYIVINIAQYYVRAATDVHSTAIWQSGILNLTDPDAIKNIGELIKEARKHIKLNFTKKLTETTYHIRRG